MIATKPKTSLVGMHAARYTQGVGLAFQDVLLPRLEPGDLCVRVEAAGICGTDLKIAAHGHRKLRAGQTITLGHEFVGEIVEVEGRAEGLEVGQRIGVAPNLGCGTCEMCRRALMHMCPDYTAFGITFDGAQAPYVRVPAAAVRQGCVVTLPEDADPVALAMAEPLSCVLNAQKVVNVGLGDTVVIFGGGPMGLLNVMTAAARGAGRVILADRNDDRLTLAQEVGATDTVDVRQQSVTDWLRENMAGRGVDVVITAAPSADVQREALSILAPFGRLSLFAGLPRGQAEPQLDTNTIHYKSLIVTGTTGGSVQDYREAVALIQRGRIDVRKLVSHVFRFDQLLDAYKVAACRQSMKVVVVGEGIAP